MVASIMAAAHARNINVLATLWLPPSWANGGAGQTTPPSDPQTFADFAGWIARYDGIYHFGDTQPAVLDALLKLRDHFGWNTVMGYLGGPRRDWAASAKALHSTISAAACHTTDASAAPHRAA